MPDLGSFADDVGDSTDAPVFDVLARRARGRLRRRAALTLGGTALVIGAIALAGTDRTTTGRAAPISISTSTTNPAPTVPSVIGLDTATARRLLTDLGLEVTTRVDRQCGPPKGVAESTDPPAGTPVASGDRVQLAVFGGTDPCSSDQDTGAAWQLLRFARGVGPAPVFAGRVAVFDRSTALTTLSPDQAGDLDTWACRDDPCSSPIGLLASQASRPWTTGNVDAVTYATPYLATYPVGPSSHQGALCAFLNADVPPALHDRPAWAIDLAIPTDGIGCRRPLLLVYRDGDQSDGPIDAIMVIPPATNAGEPLDPSPAEQRLADQFVAYARGGPPPAFDTSVRLLLGNQDVKHLTGQQATDPDQWQLPCRAYAERTCAVLSPLVAVSHGSVATFATVEHQSDACHQVLSQLTNDLADFREESVSLGIAETPTCGDNYEVQIWHDLDEKITAVNLIYGSP